MANLLAENPWVIDTASAVAVFTRPVKVTQFELIDYNDPADGVTITNQNGQIVWKATGTTDLTPARSGKVGWLNGLIIPTLTSGKLLVWFE